MNERTLFWAFVVVNLLDFWLTSLILNLGGREANPWVNFFIQHFGNIGILYVKMPFLILLGLITYVFWDHIRPSFQHKTRRIMLLLVRALALINVYSVGIYLSYL